MTDRREIGEWLQALKRAWQSQDRRFAFDGDLEARVRQARSDGDVTFLIRALADPSVRTSAARALAALEAPEATAPLTRLLAADDWRVRACAAKALGAVPDETTVEVLLDTAETDRDAAVRGWAVSSLGRIGDRSAVPGLIDLLDSPSPSFRRTTAVALAELGHAGPLYAIRRRERFVPRFLRGARPTAPTGRATAVALTLSWTAAAAAGTVGTQGVLAWIVELAIAAVFHTLWSSARERAAERDGRFSRARRVVAPIGARLFAVAVAAAWTVALGVVVVHESPDVLVNIFLIVQHALRNEAERRDVRQAGFTPPSSAA